MLRRFLNTDTLLGAATLVFALVWLGSSYQQSAAVFVLPGDAPPFLVPQLFLYFTLLLGAVILIGGLRKGGVNFGDVDWGRVAMVIAVVALATLLMRPLGYLIVGPLAVFIVVFLLGFRNHLVNVVVGLGVVAFLYILLVNFAQMPLPKVPGLGI